MIHSNGQNHGGNADDAQDVEDVATDQVADGDVALLAEGCH